MTDKEKLTLVGNELARAIRELSALRELVAVLLAEIATASLEKVARLDQIIEDERAAVYSAVTSHELINESLQQTLQQKAEFKEGVFHLSREILARIEGTRKDE